MTENKREKETSYKYSSTSAFSKLIGIIVLCSAIIGFSFRYLTLKVDQGEQIHALQQSIAELKSAINVDSIRQQNISKILAILERFNPEMSTNTKYDIANEIYAMSLKYDNLDVDLICATITHESNRTWNPEVRSHVGAIGLMQIMPLTGMYIAKLESITWTNPEDILTNPVYNIRLGCRYLSSMISSYDVDGGLAAYNGGERKAAQWVRSNRADGILWAETSKYVPSVLSLYEEYRKMN